MANQEQDALINQARIDVSQSQGNLDKLNEQVDELHNVLNTLLMQHNATIGKKEYTRTCSPTTTHTYIAIYLLFAY